VAEYGLKMANKRIGVVRVVRTKFSSLSLITRELPRRRGDYRTSRRGSLKSEN